jgi:hypothetical protein
MTSLVAATTFLVLEWRCTLSCTPCHTTDAVDLVVAANNWSRKPERSSTAVSESPTR